MRIRTKNACSIVLGLHKAESSAGAAGLGAFAAEIGGEDFDGAAHLEQAGAHAAADALFERVFADGHGEFAAGEAGRFALGGGVFVGGGGGGGGGGVV